MNNPILKLKSDKVAVPKWLFITHQLSHARYHKKPLMVHQLIIAAKKNTNKNK